MVRIFIGDFHPVVGDQYQKETQAYQTERKKINFGKTEVRQTKGWATFSVLHSKKPHWIP